MKTLVGTPDPPEPEPEKAGTNSVWPTWSSSAYPTSQSSGTLAYTASISNAVTWTVGPNA